MYERYRANFFQIILSFLFSAYLTLIWTFASYLFGLIDPDLLQPVDKYVFNIRPKANNERWASALRDSVLAFSDQQTVTGIAILIAGAVALNSTNNDAYMDVYHYQIVTYLAWMSSNVHLSCLSFVGDSFHQNKAASVFRITGMIVLFVLLCIALVPSVHQLWSGLSDGSGWAFPARCGWVDNKRYQRNENFGKNRDAIWSYAILAVSYTWKLNSAFRSSHRFFRKWIRGYPEYYLEKALRHAAGRYRERGGSSRLYYMVLVSCWVVFECVLDFLGSFASSLWMLTLGLVWGSMQILLPRSYLIKKGGPENTWIFGQIVPMILLVLPLGAFLQPALEPLVTKFCCMTSRHPGRDARQSREKLDCTKKGSKGQNHDYQPVSFISEEDATKGTAAGGWVRGSDAANLKDLYNFPPDFKLSAHFARLEPELRDSSHQSHCGPISRDALMPPHHRYLYTSTFTKLIVWEIQLGILGVAVPIFVLSRLAADPMPKHPDHTLLYHMSQGGRLWEMGLICSGGFCGLVTVTVLVGMALGMAGRVKVFR